MVKLLNLVKVNIATAGTGTVTFGSAFSTAFFTPSEAGAADGDSVSYVLVEGNDTEIGTGVIGSSATTMTRTVLKSKIGGVAGTTKMTLGGTAWLAFTALDRDILIPAVRSITGSSDTLIASDLGKTIILNRSSAIALAVTAAATLGAGWYCDIINTSSGIVTIDPNSAETIDGATTASVYQSERMRIVCDGTSFYTLNHGGEWVAYTPTLSASGGGSFTTISSVARWKKIRTTVFLHVEVLITTAGTASGTLLISPPPAGTPLRKAFLTGASLSTGKVMRGLYSAGSFRCDNYDNTNLIASGSDNTLDGSFEVAS